MTTHTSKSNTYKGERVVDTASKQGRGEIPVAFAGEATRRNKREEELLVQGVDGLGPSFAFGSVFCGAGQEGSVVDAAAAGKQASKQK